MVRHLQKLLQRTRKPLKEENKKIKKKRRALGAGYPNTTPHSLNTLTGVDGDQLQPGVEDGEIPTEVVAEEYKKILKKRRALSTRERGQQKHQQPGLSNFYEKNIMEIRGYCLCPFIGTP